MDEGFAAYTGLREILLIEVYDFFMRFVVTCNDEASFDADKLVTYIKGCGTATTFVLKVRWGNVIMCAEEITQLRSQKYCTS